MATTTSTPGGAAARAPAGTARPGPRPWASTARSAAPAAPPGVLFGGLLTSGPGVGVESFGIGEPGSVVTGLGEYPGAGERAEPWEAGDDPGNVKRGTIGDHVEPSAEDDLWRDLFSWGSTPIFGQPGSSASLPGCTCLGR